MAGWADTEALIKDVLPGARLEIPTLSDDEAAELEAAVKSHEVQGALQALLATRLTDAPESDAAIARAAVRLAIAGAGVVASRKRRNLQIEPEVGLAMRTGPQGQPHVGCDGVVRQAVERILR